MILQAGAPSAAHPLSGTVADWLWLVPMLPLLGFVVNGLLSIVPAFRRGPADPDPHAVPHHDEIIIPHTIETSSEHGSPRTSVGAHFDSTAHADASVHGDDHEAHDAHPA